MTPKEAAIRFKMWAAEQGLIDTKAGYGLAVTPDAVVLDNAMLSTAFTTTTSTLVRKHITLVGYDDSANAVVVFTARKLTKKDMRTLPKELTTGINIRYYQCASSHSGGQPPTPFNGQAATLHNGRYTCGSSVFVGDAIGAGTLGCLVRDAAGALFGLSCNHVTGGSNHSEAGLPVMAPGSIDVAAGGFDPFTLGHHSHVLPMTDGAPSNVNVSTNTDAALFQLKDPGLVSSMQRDHYDTPAQVIPLLAGMQVQKIGRTTGLTTGVVRAKSVGPHDVFYRHAERGLSKVVFFDPVFVVEGSGPANVFSECGDSGALVTTEVGGVRKAVGLVFAGDPTTGTSMILPIDDILTRFAVTLVSGHNI